MSRDAHVDDKLAELALDLLPAEERGPVVLHLDACGRCRRELARIEESVAGVAALAPRVRPSPELRRRVLGAVEGRARYAPFVDRVARFFGVDTEEATAALEAITSEGAWSPGPMPGMATAKLPRSANVPGRTAVLLRSDAGARSPLHRHLGEERLLILEGGIVESDGRAFHAGDLVVKPSGSSHAFHVPEGEPCVAAYLLDGGLELVE
jgi:anti-sigma factor ChrR (cupin superfamily)